MTTDELAACEDELFQLHSEPIQTEREASQMMGQMQNINLPEDLPQFRIIMVPDYREN